MIYVTSEEMIGFLYVLQVAPKQIPVPSFDSKLAESIKMLRKVVRVKRSSSPSGAASITVQSSLPQDSPSMVSILIDM